MDRHANAFRALAALAVLAVPLGLSAQPSRSTSFGPLAYDPYTGFVEPSYGKSQSGPVPWRPSYWDTHEGWVSKYLYERPTVSPYLELLRHDVAFYDTTKYYALVVPQLRQRAKAAQGRRLVRPRLHFDPATGTGDLRPAATATATGHSTHFASQLAFQGPVALRHPDVNPWSWSLTLGPEQGAGPVWLDSVPSDQFRWLGSMLSSPIKERQKHLASNRWWQAVRWGMTAGAIPKVDHTALPARTWQERRKMVHPGNSHKLRRLQLKLPLRQWDRDPLVVLHGDALSTNAAR